MIDSLLSGKTKSCGCLTYKQKDRLGQESLMNCGLKAKIIVYRLSTDIDVLFEDGRLCQHKNYYAFRDKTLEPPGLLHKNGITYNTKNSNTSRNFCCKYQDEIYDAWTGMIERCYNQDYIKKHPTYAGCKMLKEWLDFQNFLDWAKDNYYSVGGETINLDKDLLSKEEKLYSPETCCFLPQSINKIFSKHVFKNKELPTGITAEGNKWYARSRDMDARYEKSFYNLEEAIAWYNNLKKEILVKRTNTYKEFLPKKVYNALLTYEFK